MFTKRSYLSINLEKYEYIMHVGEKLLNITSFTYLILWSVTPFKNFRHYIYKNFNTIYKV